MAAGVPELKMQDTKLQHNKALHPTAYSLRFGRNLQPLQLAAAGAALSSL